MSLDPISSVSRTKEVNPYVKAPGKEKELLEKDKRTASARSGMDEFASDSCFDDRHGQIFLCR